MGKYNEKDILILLFIIFNIAWIILVTVSIFLTYAIVKQVINLFKKLLTKHPDSSQDESSQTSGQGSPVCPICNRDYCAEDHESIFLFDRDQYRKHSDIEHIKLTQKGEGHPVTIFTDISQFKKLKTVAMTGLTLDDSSLSNLFQCTSIRSLKLSKCQLTSVPGSLSNLKDLEILDLSHNDLTALPAKSISSMSCLKSLNVSHNRIPVIGRHNKFRSVQHFDMSYNDIEELPYELLEMKNLESLSCSHNKIRRWLEPPNAAKQISACSLNFLDLSNNLLIDVPKPVKELKNLSVINLSDNKIGSGANANHKILRQQLAELFYLPLVSKLQLGRNDIKSLPSLDTTKVSPNIELLDFSNNEIYEVPSALLLLPKLEKLLLGGNNITKLPMDLDLKNLSPSLCVVDLNNNKLVELPLAVCFLPSLEKLTMKQNKMRKISENIKRCGTLSVLDVSANKLKEIPSYVIGLPKLVEIRASNNEIRTVSSPQKDGLSLVEVVVLADNAISNFPEVLMSMPKLKYVDLSTNEIKFIPESVRNMPKDVRLNLQDNPIIDPPLEVCQAGIQAIGAFHEDLTTASSITQCLKTLFLGTYEAGKTSLIRALQLNRSNLTRQEERTHGIEIAEINLEVPNTSDITLSVWDFAGQETYYITHQFFLSSKALMLLIVNVESYNVSPASFYSTCGYWLENMIAKVGNPVVIPVVTHIDKLPKKEVDRVCKDLAKKLEDQEKRRTNDLQRQLERIDGSLLESEVVMRDRKKRIEVLLQNRPSIHPKPVPVSSSESLEGIQYLTQVILNYAVNKDFFPEVGRTVPKVWAETEACVESLGGNLSLPYMTWADFASYLTTKVPNLQPESRTKTVAQYLHDTGKILWYSEIESLRKHVFLKPASLVDIFRKVIRYDIKKVVDYEADPSYREAEITRAEFDTMKNDLVRNGILDTKLLRCLWSDVERECRQETFEGIFPVLIELMKQFDLCYELCNEEYDVGHTKQNVKNQHPLSQKLLLPWYIKEDLGDKANRQWEKGVGPVISLQYQFPSFIPPGMFARLTVRAHSPKHNLHFALHWSSGTLCKHKRNSILVVLKNEGAGRLVVSLSARPETKNVHREKVTEDIWSTLQGLSLEVEELLKQWPGVRFDRFAVCPNCHKPSFPGEWLHRTCRGSEEREICSSCSERVLLKCLVPPADGIGRQTLPGASDLSRTNLQRLSDRQLLQVAKTLGAEWEDLAIHMEFTQADVYKFKCDNPSNAQKQILTMLRTWRDREGSKGTVGYLQRIFQEAGLHCDAL